MNAVAEKDWDPSVKSLVAFPQVLAWMDQNLDWTRTLGEAFLAEQPQLLDTVQRLRQRAQSAGNLRSDQHVSIVDEGAAIEIEPADPAALYVPYYDPTLIYGNWWWPGYPPVAWQPLPGYYVAPAYAAADVYWSPPIIISTGFFFGDCDWRHHRVRVVNVNNFYYGSHADRQRFAAAGRSTPASAVPETWHHDPAHRRGIAYRLPALQGRFAPAALRQPEIRRDSPLPPAPQNRGAAPVRPEMHAVIAPATEPRSHVIPPRQAGGTNFRVYSAVPVTPRPAMIPPQQPRVPRAGTVREVPSPAPRSIVPFASPEPHRAAVMTPPAPTVPHYQIRTATEPPRVAQVPAPAARSFAPRAEFHAVPQGQPPGTMRAQVAMPRPADRAPPAAAGRGSHDRR